MHNSSNIPIYRDHSRPKPRSGKLLIIFVLTMTLLLITSCGQGGGISLDEDRSIPPFPPQEISVEMNDSCLKLLWRGTGVDIITKYVIYERQIGEENWQEIGDYDIDDSNDGYYSYCIKSIGDQILSMQFSLRALDIYGNLSIHSEPVSIDY